MIRAVTYPGRLQGRGAGLTIAIALAVAHLAFAQGITWKANYDKGEGLYRAGKYLEAEKYLRLAAAQAETTGDEALGRSLHLLGNNLQREGKYDEAEATQKKALPVTKKAFGEISQPVGAVLNDLGRVYLSKGSLKEADDLFAQALEVYEKVEGPTGRSLANTLNNIGAMNYLRGRWKVGERFLQKSLAVWEKRKMDDIEAANVLINLGRLRDEQGKPDDAMAYYQRVIEVAGALGKPDHPQVGMALIYQAKIHIDRKAFPDADKALKKSLTTFAKKLPDNHRFRGEHLLKLADLHYAQGHLDRAEPVYRQAVALWEKTADKPASAPETHLHLARLYQDQRELKSASRHLQQALDLYVKLIGEVTPRYAAALEQQATLQTAEGQTALAQITSARAKELRAQHAREN